MPREMMYSSSIWAKGGAKIYAIGSEKAKPSEITVGTSLYFEKELENIDNTIERRQNALEESTGNKNKYESELTVIEDKFTLKRLNQANPPKPILEISGKAFAGTKVSGKHSHIFLSQNISRSRIMEIDNSKGENTRSNWKMIITNL